MRKIIFILCTIFVVSLMSCGTSSHVSYNGNGVGMVPKCGKYKEYKYKKQKTFKSIPNKKRNKAMW